MSVRARDARRTRSGRPGQAAGRQHQRGGDPPALPGEHPDHAGKGEAADPDRSDGKTVDRARHRCSCEGDNAADGEQEGRFSRRAGKGGLLHPVWIGSPGPSLMPFAIETRPMAARGSHEPTVHRPQVVRTGTGSAPGQVPGAERPDIGPMVPGYFLELRSAVGTLQGGLPLPECCRGTRPGQTGRTGIWPSRCARRAARRKKPSRLRSSGCRRPLSPRLPGWHWPRSASATARSAPGPGG